MFKKLKHFSITPIKALAASIFALASTTKLSALTKPTYD
jgi:hypothetical protein